MTTIATRSAAAMPLAEPDPQQLKRDLRAAQTRKRLGALALIAPLAIFLLLTFVAPIVALLQRAIENPEVAATLPQTVAVLAKWDRKSALPDQAYSALAADLTRAKEDTTAGNLARRLNIELAGSRSLVMGTTRAMPLRDAEGKPLSPAAARDAIIALNAQWGQPDVWRVIAQNGSVYSPYYLLASLDLRQNVFGDIEAAPPESAIYRTIFGRTLWMSAVVTCITLLLAYPLAYWLSTMPERRANLLMILVLIPFWTSILVRVAAWIVLLQSEGLVNKALMLAGLTQSPLELVFNRVGVYISMTHILLPFMILPLYSVMKSVPATYLKAAVSLGSHPFAAFWRVYVPQTYPGIGAGVLLVFIMAGGYYITPALLGGPNEQMVSYFIAYFINTTINWGMACALGALLLAATLVLYGVYRRFAKVDVGIS
ncbi:ABC transporter permease [Herbaspirillum seropedicae]|uniref:ABC-type spermidine/putrescine transport system, permease component I protein n=1 Tax=Herbaspirillum seropedicae (strain SmR1) TaxID=757424 RepID=D8J1H5_HERSS|nr:ABC transporter permease [Herbaspirillum seropedicae]ADJ62596.1 ABC-type spermidine/putrescine transport system, permease component I protein [Herbaspirillum seropedicae SmR1]AKN64707.1 polyamine ABC transporter substrate-binding protein [Herbaspirillum seropedicae]AON53315.1 spermidine/putrescine ABC transporter permease [Herbaspirillum seropedicae]MDR6396380.1 putative spermidine/putrescine transport system permease protein [Herbaspirillum seropedicae]NQE30872.1 polyamine ABC transporter 